MIKNDSINENLASKEDYPSISKSWEKGYSHSAKNPNIPNLSIYNSIYLLNYFYKKKEAIDCLDLNVSYGQLVSDAVTISKALKELGIKKGEIVSICMPNYYQAVACFLACNRIGAVTCFLNSNSNIEGICEYLNLFESSIFINYDKSREENEIIKNNSKVEHIITLDKNKVNTLNLSDNYHITNSDDFIDFNTLESIGSFQKKLFPTNNIKDDALILFTSGTTGKPKSVLLTNQNIIAAGTYLKNSSRVKSLDGDRTLVCVPFSYPYGFATSTLMTLLSNKTAILAPDISSNTINYYMKKNPNIVFGSPALLELIMKNVDEELDLSSIKQFISGGDFLTPSFNKKGRDFFAKHGALNVEIGNGSGNAETVSCGTNPTGVENRPETAGKVLVGTDAIIVDPDTMEEKKYGEIGLLCISGKHVFKEYYKQPELTKEVKFVRDGKEYFKTGTLGFIDKDGYFTLTGRQSRFYIESSLNKIYCDKVQNIIATLDEVNKCAVVKVPDEDRLYVNKAYIVLEDGIDSNTVYETIREKLNNPITTGNGNAVQLLSYEIPTYIEFVNELPIKAGTDKVNYSLLEQDALDKYKNESKKVLKKQIL